MERAVSKSRRTWLALLTGLTAVAGAAGAVGLATGSSDPGAVVLTRLPFHSTVFAGVALAVVVAVPMALASYLTATARPGGLLAGATAGLLLLGWLAVEIAVIREFSWLQIGFAGVGLAVLSLAVPLLRAGKPVART